MQDRNYQWRNGDPGQYVQTREWKAQHLETRREQRQQPGFLADLSHIGRIANGCESLSAGTSG